MESKTDSSGVESMNSGILSHKEDNFNGIIINSNDLPSDPGTFTELLSSSLSVWKMMEKKGIWLKIPKAKSQLIPSAVDKGFDFHHAENKYVMMTKWMSDSPSTLPSNASHQVGVGCVVFNSRNEILLVKEKSGMYKNYNVWKIPTGLLEAGEDIPEGAIRETFEETGLRVKFSSILCFRHLHKMAFGKSDLFFVCLLELQDETNDKLTPQESEIEACSWMSPEVYFNQSFMKDSESHRELNKSIEKIYHQRLQRGVDSGWFCIPTSSDKSVAVLKYGLHPNGFKSGNTVLYTIGDN